MKRVGITGGIGCGKSTVVSVFESIGIACFVADKVAACYYHEPEFLSHIRSLMGNSVFNPDGTANKQAIAKVVFSDNQILLQLNQLIHPRVIQDFDRFCHIHAKDPYVLFESAILYEYGFDSMMDKIVCVYLDKEERISRLQIRDGSTRQQIASRMNNQLPAEEIMMRADYVILNYEGNPRERQVKYIDQLLRI